MEGLLFLLLTALTISSLRNDLFVVAKDMGEPYTPKEWEEHATQSLNNILKMDPQKQRAKNVILFIGDGMGMPTIAAARILKGQLNKKYEIPLAFERFPYTALSKTHSADRQVADSASTATAYLGGVKTNFGMSGLAAPYPFGKCGNDSEYEKNKVDSILTLAHKAGKSTGIVTTCRLTHASPSACYAHTSNRDWESDSDMVNVTGGCTDIAKQLIDDNKYIQVMMGGGRYKFLPNNFMDPEKLVPITSGRLDKRNLPEEWKKDKMAKDQKHKYVWNKAQFDAIDPEETDYVLGLFEPSHMQYDLERDTSPKGEPSLAEMVEKSIKILQKNKNGFFLFVEGGKIDSAHHDTLAKKALYEALGLDKAVETALKLVDLKETLVVATADHSISFATLGYGTRNNSILGLADRIAWGGASDNMPYANLVYSSGPNHPKGRKNLTGVATDDDNYLPQVGVPMQYSAHTGEDVAIYSTGPWAHLFRGSLEQTNIHYTIAYAACLGSYKVVQESDNCLQNNAAGSLLPNQLMLWVILTSLFNLFVTFHWLG